MPMTDITELEKSVLEEISREYPEIKYCLGDLNVSKREYSGAGSFTHFEPLANPIRGYPEFRRLLLSKIIALPELENGLGGFVEISKGSPVFSP